MIEFTFGIEHEGCWTVGLGDEFPKSLVTIVHTYGTSGTLIEVTNVSADRIDDVIAFLREQPVLSAVTLEHHDETNRIGFLSLSGVPDAPLVVDALVRHDCYPILPPTVENGRERWSVLTPSYEEAGNAHDELVELGNVHIERITAPNTSGIISGLTGVKEALHDLSERQREVLALAIENGYYESPRRCDIDDLAGQDRANKSTVGEHLRRAESKILTAAYPLLADTEGTYSGRKRG